MSLLLELRLAWRVALSGLVPSLRDRADQNGFRKLSAAAPQHPFALDLAEKASAFDEAAAKFSIAA